MAAGGDGGAVSIGEVAVADVVSAGATASSGRFPKSSSPTSAFNQSSAPRGRSPGVAATPAASAAVETTVAGVAAGAPEGGFFLKKLNMEFGCCRCSK
jgi:hypothetical protein